MRNFLILVSFVLFSNQALAQKFEASYLCKSFGETGYEFNETTKEWDAVTSETVKEFEIGFRDAEDFVTDMYGGMWEIQTLNRPGTRMVKVCTGNFSPGGALFCKGVWHSFYFDKNSGTFVNAYRGFYQEDPSYGGIGPSLYMGTCTEN